MGNGIPTLNETALGAFLHDIGKFWQRAHGSQAELDPEVREMAGQVLPSFEGRPTHIHALWTWQFFHWLQQNSLSFPGVWLERVRNIAAYHHRPGGGPPVEAGVQHLVTEADRLASGMDREERRDSKAEVPAAWDRFIRTPMLSPLTSVRLSKDAPNPPANKLRLARLSPSLPGHVGVDPETSDFQEIYRDLVAGFQSELRQIASLGSPRVFQSALRSLCERYWHAVPSSTVDQPDVSLYDHSRAVAAIAAALYQWHAANGGISKEALEKSREKPRFVWILGDLSGIQSALFQLQHQNVRGVAKILRARSFLMSLILDSAALDLLCRLELPPFSLVQSAGGRFLILAANTDATRRAFEGVRRDVESWMLRRWKAHLALNLSMSEPFGSSLFRRDQFEGMQALWSVAADEAKHRAFQTCYEAVLREDRFEHGPCSACGFRPAVPLEAEGGAGLYCLPCRQEQRLGGDLPKLRLLGWSRSRPADPHRSIELWNGLWLHWRLDPRGHADDWEDGFTLGESIDSAAPLAMRFPLHYVPLLEHGEEDKPAYRKHLSAEGREVRPGELKTFEHLALDALEPLNGDLYGEDLLAVIKADVDRLGAIFSQAIQHPSLGLVAGVSRHLDFFFSGRLPWLLRSDERFQSTYVVYAGGDDLLLIGPWRQSLELLRHLHGQFSEFVGNPEITISAALELVHPDEPLNRSVRHAEERLARAKQAGRNKVCAIQPEPMTWDDLARQLDIAEQLLRQLRAESLSHGFVYRMLSFDRDRILLRRGEAGYHAASWRARWGYQLRRNLKNAPAELVRFLNSILGLDESFRPGDSPPSRQTAIVAALYRNRSF